MKWISISDRTPKENERVITYFEHTGISIMEYHDLEGTEDEAMGKHYFCGYGFLTDDVTHWMPLPEKPSVGEP